MSITIKKQLDFDDIRKEIWYCDDVLETIENADKSDEFMSHLEEIYFMSGEELPTMTELNDYIRFKWEYIYESLGIDLEEEEI